MIQDRLLRWLRRRVAGHPVYVWALWAGAAITLALCPMMLADPAMLFYLFDPELLALIVIIGVQSARLQAGGWGLRVRLGLRRQVDRWRPNGPDAARPDDGDL